MPDFTNLDLLSANIKALTPTIEETAIMYGMYTAVFASRVTLLNDMKGYNIRKVSEYYRGARAVQLTEGTAIPDQVTKRGRTNQLDPIQWGDKYALSDRMIATNLEDISADVIRFLADSLSMRREKSLASLINSLKTASNTISDVANIYNVGKALGLSSEASKRAWQADATYHMIHPYQVQSVRAELADLAKPADNVTRSNINRWIMSGGMGTEVVETPLLPRKITYKFGFTATAGTFKLRAGELATGAEAITANITYSATIATLLSNIKTALDALAIGTWTVTGTVVTDITVVAPHYVVAEDELSFPRLADGTFDNALTGGVLVIQERSAVCATPFYSRNAVALDIREPFSFSNWVEMNTRTVLSSATEVYAVGEWQDDRILFYETKCNSPFAVT